MMRDLDDAGGWRLVKGRFSTREPSEMDDSLFSVPYTFLGAVEASFGDIVSVYCEILLPEMSNR